MFDAYKKKMKSLAEKTASGELLVDSAVDDLLSKSGKSVPCMVVTCKDTLMRTFNSVGPSEKYVGQKYLVSVKKVGTTIRHVELTFRDYS